MSQTWTRKILDAKISVTAYLPDEHVSGHARVRLAIGRPGLPEFFTYLTVQSVKELDVDLRSALDWIRSGGDD